MPVALAVRLTPIEDLPRDMAVGRSAHGLVFNLLRRANPSLAGEVHLSQIKPLSVAALVDQHGRRPQTFRAGETTWLRVSLLDDRIYRAFLDSIPDGEPFALGTARMEWSGWVVSNGVAPCDPAAASYGELLEGAREGDHTLRLRFLTPTAISQGDADLPLPVPSKLWAGYAARWRAFAPEMPLPDELDEGVERWLRLSDFDLRPARWRYRFVDGKGTDRLITHLGCRGWIEVGLDRKATPAFAQAFRALAAYSFYCGSGMKTTMGMGQTRLG